MPVLCRINNMEGCMRNLIRYRFVINVLTLLLVFGAMVPDARAQEGIPLYLPLIPQGVSQSNSASDELPGEETAPVTETISSPVNPSPVNPSPVIPSLVGEPAAMVAAAAFTASLQLSP